MSNNSLENLVFVPVAQQFLEMANRADLVNRFNTVMGEPDPVVAIGQQNFVAGKMTHYEIQSLARLYTFLLDAAEQG